MPGGGSFQPLGSTSEEEFDKTYRMAGGGLGCIRSDSHRNAMIGRVPDPDAITRLCERDMVGAVALLKETIQPRTVELLDWPDKLAAALASNLDFSIEQWAAAMNLAPQSISRGFRQAYGVSPKRYRLEQRTLHARGNLRTWTGSLADLAAASGFSDQAHLTRAIVALTGLAPTRLKVKYVQEERGALR